MKRLLFLFIAMAALTSCRFNLFRGDGPNGVREITSQPFDRVEVLGACDVKFTQGDTFAIKIEGPTEAIKEVKTEFSATTLVIKIKDESDFINIFNHSAPVIYLTSPDLIGIKIKGVGSFDVPRHLDTDTLNIELKGIGKVNLNDVICDELHTRLDGTGAINISNLTSQHSSFILKGMGDVSINFLQGGDVSCALKGVGNMSLSGKVKSLRKSIQGTGNINVEQLKISE